MAPLTCIKCGTAIERAPGAGRPPRYCGDACKRLVEYEIRRLDRRLAGYELEQRGLKYDGTAQWDDEEEERQKRMRALRKWIRQDEARLRFLLVGGRADESPARSNQSRGAK